MSITERQLAALIKRFDQPSLVIGKACGDGGTDPLWARFERAALNQINDGDAAVSRYALWANTVRDNVIEGLGQLRAGNQEQAIHYLTRSANSLSAFAEFQTRLEQD